jgi:hypothetical protein
MDSRPDAEMQEVGVPDEITSGHDELMERSLLVYLELRLSRHPCEPLVLTLIIAVLKDVGLFLLRLVLELHVHRLRLEWVAQL